MNPTTIMVVGVNHRTAPVSLRERLSVASHELGLVLRSLARGRHLQETVVLSTCNRTEIYAATTGSLSSAAEELAGFLSHRSGLAPEALRPHLYLHSGSQAVRHLFRVTAGLDSMVLGETEITAQVRNAYEAAYAHETTGASLNRLFQRALHCAKRIRSETDIAKGQSSIGSVVLALARRIYGERLKACQVLLWGAGKAAEVTTKHLLSGGVGQLWIVNRTLSKAQELAQLCQGGWLSWEQAKRHLAHVDIAIVCTQAPHYVVDASDAESFLPQRAARTLLLIDLAVPRNVEPALKNLPGIELYNIDDLSSISQEALQARRQTLPLCEAIIEEEADFVMNRWRLTQGDQARCSV